MEKTGTEAAGIYYLLLLPHQLCDIYLTKCTWLLCPKMWWFKECTREFNSVAQSSPTLCNPMPGLPVHHPLLELAQTHVYWVGNAIQPSHPLWSASPSAFTLFQHHSLFQWVGSLHQVAKVWELQLQHQSFQWIFRTDFL